MNAYDMALSTIMNSIGQLMVTSFLFYSGFGIYESIKSKKDYMKTFFKKRFVSTYFNFFVAIFLFILTNLILNNVYDFKTIALSFTGYESIGNSNWYMLCIFFLYLVTMLCFYRKVKLSNIYRIILVMLFSIIYMFVITKFKPDYYASTILCFPCGMLFSYYKDKIDSFLIKNYYKTFIVILIVLCLSYYLSNLFNNIYTYDLFAIFFILLIVIISMKIKLNNKVYYYFGSNVFYIYILQRIPMMLFNSISNNYLFFAVSLISTLLLSYVIKKITNKMQKCFIK